MPENLSAKCYQDSKERLQKKRERYQNLSDDEKNKLVGYRKKCYGMKKKKKKKKKEKEKTLYFNYKKHLF